MKTSFLFSFNGLLGKSHFGDTLGCVCMVMGAPLFCFFAATGLPMFCFYRLHATCIWSKKHFANETELLVVKRDCWNAW